MKLSAAASPIHRVLGGVLAAAYILCASFVVFLFGQFSALLMTLPLALLLLWVWWASYRAHSKTIYTIDDDGLFFVRGDLVTRSIPLSKIRSAKGFGGAILLRMNSGSSLLLHPRDKRDDFLARLGHQKKKEA